jgi:hypothetical protein
MANKILLIIVTSVIFWQELSAQHFVFRPEFLCGTFDMRELKVLQKSILTSQGVEPKTLSSFPPYFGYGLSMMYAMRSGLRLGLTSDFISTGARNYYADYSGSYKYDLLVRSYNIGLIASKGISLSKKQTLYLEMEGGIKSSYLDNAEKLVVNQMGFDNKNSYKGYSYWIKPLIIYDISILRNISLGAFAGAEFNPKSYPLDQYGDPLVDRYKHKISINWTGLRIGLNCSFHIPGQRT